MTVITADVLCQESRLCIADQIGTGCTKEESCSSYI